MTPPMMPPPHHRMHKRPPKEKPKNFKEFLFRFFSGIKAFLSRLLYIISLVWETAPHIFIAMIALCVLNGVLPVIGAYISRDLLNEISILIGASLGSFAEEILGALRPVLFLFILQFIYLFLHRILERVNDMVTAIAGELVVNHIKLKIIGKAKEVDVSSFDRPEFYEKLENANREAGMRPIGILTATFRVISAIISVASFVVVLATLSPIAPVIVIICALPSAIVTYVFKNKNYVYMRRHSKERREMSYYSQLMVSKDYVKEIKILGLGDTFTEKYKNVFARYFKGLKSLMVRESVTRMIVSLLITLGNCALFAYVAYEVIYNGRMIGDYTLYTGALTSVSTYVTTIVTATATIYEGTLFIDNMMEFMKEKVRVVSTLSEPRRIDKKKNHVIELKNVSFSYPGTDRKVVNNVNLRFASGESTVLVGLNGAGKTTLINLITRMYDVTEGEILLDGYNIKEYDPGEYYDLFGIVFQHFGKYAESAADNIRFGDVRREENREDIIAAAVSGNADGFIEALPDGYETPLTRVFEENGIELSGGQWQKLSVARAFYKKSEILILDEPTASLDAIAEQEIFGKFEELSEGKISIFVSHRLSSAVTAGQIAVLEDGKLVELGTHEQLMAKESHYYRLFSTQAHRYGVDC